MSADVVIQLAAPDHNVATKLGRSLEDFRMEFSVDSVTSVAAGLEALKESSPDCVVATTKLADGNGIELLEGFRSRAPELPFVLLVDPESDRDAGRAFDANVTACIPWETEDDSFETVAQQIGLVLEDQDSGAEWYRPKFGEQSLFREMNDGMAVHELVTDKEGEPTDYRILDVNPQYEEILDIHREAVVGELASEVYDGEGAPLLDRYATVAETGESIEFETEQPKLGKHFKISAFSPEEGLFATIFSDITEKRAARKKLERQTAKLEEAVQKRQTAENRYRELFEKTPVVVWEEDFSAAKVRIDEIAAEHGDLEAYLEENPGLTEDLFQHVEFLNVNEAALEYYEADSKAELLESIGELMTPESRAANRKMWQAIADGQSNFRAETVSKTLTGKRRDEIFEYHVPDTALDDFSRVYVSSIDITKRKARERELKRLKERFELAVEGANLAVWDWDMTTDTVYRDHRWAQMLGHDPDSIGSGLEDFFRRLHPEDARIHEDALEAHVDGEAALYECQYRLRTNCGDWKWIQNVGRVIEWDGDMPARAVGIHRDVDERRQIRDTLKRNNELLQAVDRVLRHNLNNDMNVIQGYAETIRAQADGPIQAQAETILETGEELLETVQKERMVVETLSESVTPESRDLVDLADRVVRRVSAEYPSAEVHLSSPESLDVRAVDSIERALEELIVNGIKHSDVDPVVHVDLGGNSNRAWVRVADTGRTIPEMERAVLSEEGAITPLYHGSGFGLWLVSQAVRRSGGSLSFEERVPSGNVVTITVPRTDSDTSDRPY